MNIMRREKNWMEKEASVARTKMELTKLIDNVATQVEYTAIDMAIRILDGYKIKMYEIMDVERATRRKGRILEAKKNIDNAIYEFVKLMDVKVQ